MADKNEAIVKENEVENEGDNNKGIDTFNQHILEVVWAKLNSLTKKIKGVEISKEILSIGRAADNDLLIKD